MTYGKQIRTARLRAGLTQKNCAQWWGCTEKTWIGYEKGENNHFRAALRNYFLLAIERGVFDEKRCGS